MTLREPSKLFEGWNCPRCGLPNPKARDPVAHQEANCPYCRAGGALKRGNTAPTWQPGEPVQSDYPPSWIEQL